MSVDHIVDRFQHLCYILIHIDTYCIFCCQWGSSDSSDPSSLVETEAALFCSSSWAPNQRCRGRNRKSSHRARGWATRHWSAVQPEPKQCKHNSKDLDSKHLLTSGQAMWSWVWCKNMQKHHGIGNISISNCLNKADLASDSYKSLRTPCRNQIKYDYDMHTHSSISSFNNNCVIAGLEWIFTNDPKWWCCDVILCASHSRRRACFSMALHEQWVSQKKWNKNGMSYKAKQGKTRQNKARTWKSHHHWELEALHGMLLGGSSLKPLWTNGLYDTILQGIILYHLVSISNLDWFALRKWQLVSQVHTLRSSALWPKHSCQFQGQVARLPWHLTPWIQIDPMNLTSSMTCFSDSTWAIYICIGSITCGACSWGVFSRPPEIDETAETA